MSGRANVTRPSKSRFGPTPRHFCMIVHGIGWNGMSRAEAWGYLEERFMPQYSKVMESQIMVSDADCHFDLVEWHEELHIAQQLDAKFETIALTAAVDLRNAFFRDHVMDGLAYLLAYKEKVLDAVVQQLNFRYRAFMKKFPQFEGEISIIGHSLGSLLSYDILTCHERRSTLKFSVMNLVVIGSPMPAYFVLQNTDKQVIVEQIQDMVAYGCKFMNVFHPMDGVAYRMEPLIIPGYEKVAPVKVPPWDHRLLLQDPLAPGCRNVPPQSVMMQPDDATGGTKALFEGCPRIDFELRGDQGSLGVGEMMATVMAHKAYWESPDFMRFVLDATPGFRTVPGRTQQLAGKGSAVGSLGVFSWSLYTFKTGAKQKHEVAEGWRKTKDAVVHVSSSDPDALGMVYVCREGQMIKMDPRKLAPFNIKQSVETNQCAIEGYCEVMASEEAFQSCNCMCMLHDQLFIFSNELRILDVLDPTNGSRQLTKGWGNTKAVVCDGTTMFAVGDTRQGSKGALYTVLPDGISDNLITHKDFYDAKAIACIGDEVFIFAASIWAVHKRELTIREVAQGWEQTVAVTSDEEWLYVVNSTGVLPHIGSLWRIDIEGRSECLSDDGWGLTKAVVLFDRKVSNGRLFEQ